MVTLEKWMKRKFQTSRSSVQDSHARVLVTLAKDWDSMTKEERYSLRSLGLLKKSDLKSYSLKMLEDYLVMTEAGRSHRSSPHYMSWGMISNGKLSTGCILFRKAAREYSLSDILESNP